MRVTQKMMADSARINLMSQSERLFELQNTLSSGKRVDKPSDDPLDMGRILDQRTFAARLEQYQTNIDRAKSRVELNDLALETISDLLAEARSAVELAPIESEQTRRDSLAAQIERTVEQITDLANTRFEGNYIFSGHQSKDPAFKPDELYLPAARLDINGDPIPRSITIPFFASNEVNQVTVEIINADTGALVRNFDSISSAEPILNAEPSGYTTLEWDGRGNGGEEMPAGHYRVNVVSALDQNNIDLVPLGAITNIPMYNGDDGEFLTRINQDSEVPININGDTIFPDEDGDGVKDILKELTELAGELRRPGSQFTTEEIQDAIDAIIVTRERIQDLQAANASTRYSLDSAEEFIDNFRPTVQKLRDELENADLIETATFLKSQETIYQTALQTTARVIQPTLLDFLG